MCDKALHSNINKVEKQAVEPVLSQFDEISKRIVSRFARLEAKQAALAYIQGLISPVERKNSLLKASSIEVKKGSLPHFFMLSIDNGIGYRSLITCNTIAGILKAARPLPDNW